MRLRPTFIIALVCGLVLLASSLAMGRLRSARVGESAAIAQLQGARADVQELVTLRAQAQRIGSGRRAPEDVTARLRDALLATGLATARLTQYAEAGDTEVPGSNEGPRYRRQSIHFTLSPMELSELGLFLDHWRQSEPLWVPISIEMTRSASRSRNVSESYTAAITVAATYLDTSARTTP